MKDLILIVDDTPENLQVLGQHLRQAEYNVAMAMNGKEAIEFLQTKELPQLILLDVNMPDMNGFDTCRRIKEANRLKDIPIIFLTARTESNDVVEGFAAGGVDYVTKPFQPVELLARIRTHIQLKKSREEVMLLQGMLPICSNCHNVRDDDGYWTKVDTYLSSKSIPVSHSICPNCIRKLYPEMADELLNDPNVT